MSNTIESDQDEKRLLENRLARVTEKLEQSQAQIALLEAKNEQLLEELREAKWKGVSSVRPRRPSPSLPTELLRMIFQLATSFDGLGFDGPLVSILYYPALHSSLLFHISQIQALQQVLISKAVQPLQQDRIKFIRNIELIPFIYLSAQSETFAAAAQDVLTLVPPQQLELFAIHLQRVIDPADYTFDDIMMNMAGNIIQKHEKSLKVLNLPFNPVHNKTRGVLRAEGISLSTFRKQFRDGVVLSNLHTLFLAKECWSTERHFDDMDCMSWACFPSLKTLYLEFKGSLYGDHKYEEKILKFITSARGLSCLNLIVESDLSVTHIVSSIRAAPALKRLSIYVEGQLQYEPSLPNSLEFLHESLTEIEIWKEKGASTREGIKNAIQIFYTMLEGGVLPYLRSIIIHGVSYYGPSYRGCLDIDTNVSKSTEKWWRDFIAQCTRHDVVLTDPFGHPIHLWDMVHGIRFNKEGKLVAQTTTRHHFTTEDSHTLERQVEETLDSGGSDDGKWTELNEDEEFEGSDAKSNATISDDSQDTPYRYVPQPDIDTVDQDSDVDSLYLKNLEYDNY